MRKQPDAVGAGLDGGGRRPRAGPRWRATSTVTPSSVTAGSAAARPCSPPRAPPRSGGRLGLEPRHVVRGGVDVQVAPRPSTTTVVPSAIERGSPSPTTAGIPSERASTAACEVGPPCAVAMPRTRAGSSPAVSAGVRSAAMSTPGPSSRGWGGGTPSSRASTCAPTLRRSSARARRYGSSSRPVPGGRGPLDRRRASARGRAPVRVDRAPRRAEERLVVAGTAGERRRSRPRSRPRARPRPRAGAAIGVAPVGDRRVERRRLLLGVAGRRRGRSRAAGRGSAGPARSAMPGEAAKPRIDPSTGPAPARGRSRAQGPPARRRLGPPRRSPGSERPDRVDRGGRLRPARGDLDLVAGRDAERRHRVQAGGVGRSAAARDVRAPRSSRRTVRPSARTAPRAARAARGGSGPEAQRDGARPPTPSGAGASGYRGAEVRDLPGEPAAGLVGHVLERAAQLRGDGGGHGALDERRLAQEHLSRAGPRASGRGPSRPRARRSRGPSGRARRRRTTRGRWPASRARRRSRSDGPACRARPRSRAGRRARPSRARARRRLRRAVAVGDEHDADHGRPPRPSRPVRRSAGSRTRRSARRARRARDR